MSYNSSQRQNLHLSNQRPINQVLNEAIQAHVFVSPNSSNRVSKFQEQLITNQIIYQTHQNYRDLDTLLANHNKKSMKLLIIIECQNNGSGQISTIFPKQYEFPKRQLSIRIIAFPCQLQIKNIECLSSMTETIDNCIKFIGRPSNRRIKLASVQSIKGSSSLKKPRISGKQYQLLYYHTNIYNDYDSKGDILNYQSFIEALESSKHKRVFGFTSLKDLESRQVFNSKKRNLIITSTNPKSLKFIESLKRKSWKNIDIILLGDMKPSSVFLEENIILATNDLDLLNNYLLKNGFELPSLQKHSKIHTLKNSLSSSQFKNNLLNVIRQSSQSSNATNMQGIFRSSGHIKQKAVYYWKVDKQKPASNQFQTVKIDAPNNIASSEAKRSKQISNNKQKESEQQDNDNLIVIQNIQPQSPLNQNNTMSNRQIQQNTIGSQPIQNSRTIISNNETRPIETTPTRPNQYLNRYYPQSVIPQRSEEYRGSNKDIESDIINRSNKHSTYQSRQGEQINRNIKINTYSQKRNNNQQLLNQNSKQLINMSQNDLVIETNTPKNITYIYSNNLNFNNSNNYYHTPEAKSYRTYGEVKNQPVIIRKDVTTSPQYIGNYQSSKNLGNVSFGIERPLNKQPIYYNDYQIQQNYSHNNRSTNEKAVKIEDYKVISPNKTNPVTVVNPPALNRFVNSSPIHQLRVFNQERQAINQNQIATNSNNRINMVNNNTPTIQPQTRVVSNINWDQYEKEQRNGQVYYKKKQIIQPKKQAEKINQNQPNIISPLMEPKTTTKYETKQYDPYSKRNEYLQKQNNFEINIKQPTLNSPMNRPSQSEFNKKNLSPYTQNLTKVIYSPTKIGSSKLISNIQQPKKQYRNSTKMNNLNDSNMVSRMSQLHSDGSIMRRNNIRFGVRPKKIEKQENVFEKLTSGIYKDIEMNKKITLNKFIAGEEYLQSQINSLIHINTKFNNFHFIIQEEMSYIVNIIKNYVATNNDKIEVYTGTEELFEYIRPDKVDGKFDVGFIFARKQQLKAISINLFPEDYYIVTIQRSEQSSLQINESIKQIKIDQLKYINLAQKEIIDSKLYQYVAYRNNKKEIQMLADKFMNTEFILQKIEKEFTSEIIDFYYCQLPRLTRLYLLCDVNQLPQLLKLVKIYEEFNPSFDKQSCKLICLLQDILKNDQLIMSHPNVTFISNPEDIQGYQDILKYAHHNQNQGNGLLPVDCLFLHQKHLALEQRFDLQFPGRFMIIPYAKLSEVYLKMEKVIKIMGKAKPNYYLVLHESLNTEKIICIQKFTKVFLLGNAKINQGQVVKVINLEELLEKLRS